MPHQFFFLRSTFYFYFFASVSLTFSSFLLCIPSFPSTASFLLPTCRPPSLAPRPHFPPSSQQPASLSADEKLPQRHLPPCVQSPWKAQGGSRSHLPLPHTGGRHPPHIPFSHYFAAFTQNRPAGMPDVTLQCRFTRNTNDSHGLEWSLVRGRYITWLLDTL